MAEVDLSGQWDGHFAYPDNALPVTPFLATIRQGGVHLTGTVIEPNLYGGGAPAEAAIEGIVAGRSVDFTKTYTNPSHGYENPVDYVGQVLDDGERIAGMWSIYAMNGTFEMTRHATIESAETGEEELSLGAGTPVPTAL